MDGAIHTDVSTLNNLAPTTDLLGSDVSNNIAADENCFEDASAADFRLTATCAGIDAGAEISGITDGFSGVAPDAILRIPLVSTDAYGRLDVARAVADPWDATTVSRATADPAANDALGSVAVTGHSHDAQKVGVTYDLDVTRAVAGWIDGTWPNSGFALTAPEGYTVTRRIVSGIGSGQPVVLRLEIDPGDTGAPEDSGDTADSGGGDTAAGDSGVERG